MSALQLVTASILFLAVANAQAASITSLVYGGSGCPQGSVDAVVAPDGSSLTVLYSSLSSNVNRDIRADARDCTVAIKVAKPVTQALILESADFRGFVRLEHGVAAKMDIDVQSGYGRYLLNQQFALTEWRGPISQDYFVSSIKPVSTQGNLIECLSQLRKDTKFQFKTRLKMQSNSGGEGLLAVDSVDGRTSQVYRFKAVNCF